MGAELIDVLVFLAAALVLSLLFPTTTVSEVLGTVLTVLYNALLDGSERGQTIGKQVLRIHVRSDEDVEPIGVNRGFVRALVPAALGLGSRLVPALALGFLVAALLNVLWPLWDSRRQAWHDKAAGSVVLKVEGS